MRIVDRLPRTNLLFEETRGHRRDVFVAETKVSSEKSGITNGDVIAADLANCEIDHSAAGEDLLGDRLRPICAAGSGKVDLALNPGDIELEEPPPLDDLSRDRILAIGEDRERNRLATGDSVDHREVGAGEKTEVVAVLLVNAFDILRHDDLDSGTQFRIGRCLTAGTLAAALATDADSKPPPL